jgi:predicted TIM-barrel fold metal-dependent hydrolase
MTSFEPTAEVAAIRDKLTHPVIDGDGHHLELMPRVFDLLRADSGRDVEAQFREHMRMPWATYGTIVPTRVFCGMPANTVDRMTAYLPELLLRRLPQMGIDYALLYPSQGLMIFNLGNEQLRRRAARAFNRYYAETYDGYRDRLEPVAVIPTFTPDEAIDELDHAVGELGLKSIVMSGAVPRVVRPDGTERPWIDTLGHGSLYDYDRLWQRCAELKVTPTFHAIGFGWGTRVSATNYVHNHLGSFAAAQEGVCRALIMGGVVDRFPTLRFNFLEGGAAWAAQLRADLKGHFEKRNKHVVERSDDFNIDRDEAVVLFSRYATGALNGYTAAFADDPHAALHSRRNTGSIDDFADSGITAIDDVDRLFDRLAFGCEGDDPLNGLAFDHRYLKGRSINAFFASDIGHWDVPDFSAVLAEAYELVEHDVLSEVDFERFAFTNTLESLTATNPDFFASTAIDEVHRQRRTRP